MVNRITRILLDQWRWLLLSLVVVLTACTNSEWFLSIIYNRADNMMAEEVYEYADYTDEQSEKIDEMIDQFHLWHRVTQLPQYADFLDSVSARMRTGERLEPSEIHVWYDRIEAFAINTGQCHPMLFSTDIMRSLTDEQISQIAEHMEHQYERYMERSEKRTAQERLERWHRNRVRWLNRFGMDPTGQEEDQLMTVLKNMPNMREANFEIWQAWDARLLELLGDRNAADFEARIRDHVLSLPTLTKEQYPDRVEQARSLWVNYLVDLLNARIAAQNHDFADWAEKMAENLRAISEKVPEEQLGWNPRQYCPELI